MPKSATDYLKPLGINLSGNAERDDRPSFIMCRPLVLVERTPVHIFFFALSVLEIFLSEWENLAGTPLRFAKPAAQSQGLVVLILTPKELLPSPAASPFMSRSDRALPRFRRGGESVMFGVTGAKPIFLATSRMDLLLRSWKLRAANIHCARDTEHILCSNGS